MSEEQEIKVNIELPPTVFDFFQAEDFVTMIVGPVGSGKSSGCCLKGTMKLPREMPAMDDGVRRSRGCVIRNTYPQLRDTTIRTFKEWLRNSKLDAATEWKVSDHTCTIKYPLDDGTSVEVEVLFRALDRPQDVENLLSLELTWVYINEWREVPKAVTDLVQTRVGRFPRKEDVPRYWTGVFGDSNAFDTDHYLYKLFFEPDPETGERVEGHRAFVQPGGLDKDAENIERLDACFDPRPEDLARVAKDGENVRSPEVKARYRAIQMARIAAGEHEKPCRCYYPRMMKGKKQSWIDCYVHNKFVFAVDGKPIYDNFNQRIHVADFEDGIGEAYYRKIKRVSFGNDYGLTPAAVFAHEMPDGQIRISHEFVSQRLGALSFGEEQARILKTTFPNAKDIQGWGDPAGMAGSSVDEQKTPISVVQGCGVPVEAAPTNDFTIRRDAVYNCLKTLTMTGEPEILIHPRCKTLIKALAGAYCLKRKQVSGDEQFREVPDKNPFSHVAEAMQYLVCGLGRDHRVLDGGQDAPERVQSVHTRRSVGHEEDGPRAVSVQVIRSRR